MLCETHKGLNNKNLKNFLWEMTPPPPLITRSESGIEFPAKHAEYHGTKQHICFKTPTYSKCHSCFHFSRIEINYKVKEKKS